MRDLFFKSAMTRLSVTFLFAAMLASVAACSEGTPPAAPAATTTPPVTAVPTPTPPSGLSLSVSTTWIPTDNATQAAIMATVVDASNAILPGVYVSFSTSTGNLTASSAVTDANGQATVYLRSGTDTTNRTATITAAVGAQSASTQILIQGSTVSLTLASSSIQVGAGTITASATAKNAKGTGVFGQTIRFSIGGTGLGSFSAITPITVATLTTDASGVATPITFTPTVAGTVVLTAEWLNSLGTVTATTTQNITVTGVLAAAFAITIPATYSTSLSTGATQALAATVPATIGGTAVANVRISSSGGTWVGAGPAAGPATSILQTYAAAVAANYTAPANSGTVSVQVDALDAAGKILSSLTRIFLISAPASAAAKLFLSSSVSTIVPSTATNPSTATLEVTVRDANLNSIGGAAVMFGLLGTTGSGETVSPPVAITDDFGVARTTFTAGIAPTLAAIYAQASLVGQVCAGTMPNPTLNETNALCDATPMTVTSTAVSVTVQFGTKITDIADSTMYSLPGSVQVVNSNGSAVAGQEVSLSVFPVTYRNGYVYADQDLSASGTTLVWQCVSPGAYTDTVNRIPATVVPAEDLNRNGIKDGGEDVNGNGVLSPSAAAAGAVPLKVTTGSDGWATFALQYPKASAWFIEDEVTARVRVGGTESSATMRLLLPMSEIDVFDPICALARRSNY